MSYVECMECGDRLGCLTANHLKKHGITSKQYRRRHPKARMVSDDVRGRVGRKGRLWNRICRECGEPFTTRSTKGYHCPKCQRLREALQARKYARRYERKARNSGKDNKLGTFGKRYLEVVNCRIRGATLFERHISVNQYSYRRSPFNGSPPTEYEACLTLYLIEFILNLRRFCGECGAELITARGNENYTIPAELCCKSCGRVYEWDRAEEGGETDGEDRRDIL